MLREASGIAARLASRPWAAASTNALHARRWNSQGSDIEGGDPLRAGQFSDVIARESGVQYVTALTNTAFALSGGSVIEGPAFVSANTGLAMHCDAPGNLTVESLAPLTLLRPVPDIVVFGVGSGGALETELSKPVRDFLHDRGVAYEAMETRRAVGAYNVLLQEGRRVAAFLWPPSPGRST